MEKWQNNRIPLAQKFTLDGWDEFATAMNGMTRELINCAERMDPEFWSAWIELGQNASTMTQSGKLFIGHRDRTND